ncbi:MAG: vitamin B12 dependent-methionine synthase activation domain-containing protein, partial [Candidatus Entotheonellia bacterium]
LIPYIEREQAASGVARRSNGKMVIATVKGDVHDIGKNIVGVVLRCNNYEVIDLGVMVPAAKILDTARQEQADMIGLSGLITPSLDEMVHVAKEMERQGFEVPLLIGGATTSKTHTAVKIEQGYHGPTIHVLDASRSVGVVGQLMNAARRPAFVQEVREEYAKIREAYGHRQDTRQMLSLLEARQRKYAIDWNGYHPVSPAALGITSFEGYPLDELVPYIDWSPFFAVWELAGRYPAIFDDAVVGAQARALFTDAQALLTRIVDGRLLRAKAVVGLFPANTVHDDDIEVYTDASRREVQAVVHGLRQQFEKPPGRPNLCLADFVAPKQTGLADSIGAFAVTAGHGLDELCAAFEGQHDDYNSIMAKALADRLAEAFAERLHERVRKELWGYAPGETLSNAELIRERYAGIRPAPGYPACPDHTEKQVLFHILDVTSHTGIRLTESYAMWPAASVSGWYFAHPEASYFGLGKISRDQVEDYARRKRMEARAVERWLSTSLAYEAEG